MSAAAKLGALGDVLHGTPPESDTAAMHKLFDLADALPQIVAVVELAERNLRGYDEWQASRTGTSSSGEPQWFLETRAALAALDEALGAVT